MSSERKIYLIKNRNGIEEYYLGKQVSIGKFSNIYNLHNTNSKSIYIIKFPKEGLYENEALIHKDLRHPNIVRCYKINHDDQYLILDKCAGDLNDYFLSSRDSIHIPTVFYQIIMGLKYIHSKNIIHRDIKLKNIFISKKGDVKIGDFGLSVRYEGEKITSINGTPNYLSPEMINKGGYDFSVDVWALGVILYYLHCGEMPFKGRRIKHVMEAILKCDYKLPTKLPLEVKDIISNILILDIEQRYTLDDLLQHPYLSMFSEK